MGTRSCAWPSYARSACDKLYLDRANAEFGHDLRFLDARLQDDTTGLAAECDAACVFVNDAVGVDVLEALEGLGCRIVALMCAGFTNVEFVTARRLGTPVVRAAYSPHAVSEFTVGLMLAALRHIPRAWSRARDGNFSLDGPVGRNLFGRTVGVVGTGRIGSLVAKALRSRFGCSVLAYDQRVDDDLASSGVEYVELDDPMVRSDIVTLHCPLTPDTWHIVVNRQRLEAAKPRLVLVNTSRGKLVDTEALIDALKERRLGAAALDVYEQEENLFFQDLSDEVITDDVFRRLLTFPNVLVTGHQAFFLKRLF